MATYKRELVRSPFTIDVGGIVQGFAQRGARKKAEKESTADLEAMGRQARMEELTSRFAAREAGVEPPPEMFLNKTPLEAGRILRTAEDYLGGKYALGEAQKAFEVGQTTGKRKLREARGQLKAETDENLAYNTAISKALKEGLVTIQQGQDAFNTLGLSPSKVGSFTGRQERVVNKIGPGGLPIPSVDYDPAAIQSRGELPIGEAQKQLGMSPSFGIVNNVIRSLFQPGVTPKTTGIPYRDVEGPMHGPEEEGEFVGAKRVLDKEALDKRLQKMRVDRAEKETLQNRRTWIQKVLRYGAIPRIFVDENGNRHESVGRSISPAEVRRLQSELADLNIKLKN